MDFVITFVALHALVLVFVVLGIRSAERTARSSGSEGFGLASLSDEELVAAFNRQVGNTGWSPSRGRYLAELRSTLESRGWNLSAVRNEHGGLSYKCRVRLAGRRLAIDEPVPQSSSHQ